MIKYWNVIDYPGYVASDDGKVYKLLPTGELEELEQHMDEFGYASVYLKNPAGIICEKPVARIIATLFSKTCLDFERDGHIDDDPWDPMNHNAVCHKNGDLQDNRIENLRWIDTLCEDNSDDPIRANYISERKNFKTRPGETVYCQNEDTGEILTFSSHKEAETVLGITNIRKIISGERKAPKSLRIWK